MALEPQAVKTEVDADVVVGIASAQSVSATQGTAAASSANWPVRITDGTDDAPVDATYGLAVDVKQIVGVTVSGTATVTQGTAAAVGGAWPILVTDGTDTAPVDATNGLAVDIKQSVGLTATVSGTATVTQGTPAASANAWPVQISNGTIEADVGAQNSDLTNGLLVMPVQANASAPTFTEGYNGFLSTDLSGQLRTLASVTEATPTTPTIEYDSGSAIAPAGTDTLDSASITAGTKKLRSVFFSATAQCKAELVKVENGVESGVLATLLTSNTHPSDDLPMPHQDFCTITNSAGADNFRLKVTNIEPAGGGNADVFATFFVNE